MEDVSCPTVQRPNVMRGTVLVGEGDGEACDHLELALRCQGIIVKSARDTTSLLASLRDDDGISAVLLDGAISKEFDGTALREIRRHKPEVPVIMVSGLGSPAEIVQAMKDGASDFLIKPVNPLDLSRALQRVLTKAETPKRIDSAHPQIFYGSSAAMQEIRGLLPVVAASEVPVLILGETGTGKEALARTLHALSPRAAKPFVKLNCAAIPAELVESELFGHEKGSFTGAMNRKPGLFEMANHGTILLDEIGDMDFKLQAKLLQVLQDHEFRRVGGQELIRVDVRVIASTHRDLRKAILENRFREDLYYRLNVCEFVVPALRERAEDIPGLANFLMDRYRGTEADRSLLTPELIRAMKQFSWPGNVRELENVVRRLMTFKQPTLIVREFASSRGYSVTQQIHAVAPKAPVSEHAATLENVSRAKSQAESEAIKAVLEATHWNRKRAAALLKIDYKALLYKMKKLEIDRDEAVNE